MSDVPGLSDDQVMVIAGILKEKLDADFHNNWERLSAVVRLRTEEMLAGAQHEAAKGGPCKWDIDNRIKQLDAAFGATRSELTVVQDVIEVLKAKLPDVGKALEKRTKDKARAVLDLGLSTRTSNCLRNDNRKTVRDLVGMSSDDLRRIPNFGKASLADVKRALAKIGMKLRAE